MCAFLCRRAGACVRGGVIAVQMCQRHDQSATQAAAAAADGDPDHFMPVCARGRIGSVHSAIWSLHFVGAHRRALQPQAAHPDGCVAWLVALVFGLGLAGWSTNFEFPQ